MLQGDAQAVFVDDAPAVAKDLARIEAGDLPLKAATERLRAIYQDHGRRLVQAPGDDPDLLIQVDHAIQSLVERDRRFASALPSDDVDAVLLARQAATAGAMASARRWLDDAPEDHPLRDQLSLSIQPDNARSTLHHGDAIPNDLIAAPLWHQIPTSAGMMPLITGDVLVLSGPDRIECVDVINGRHLWHRESLGADVIAPGQTHGGVLTVDAVRGGDIVAWIGQPVSTGFEGGGRIMRLAADNGALRWDFDPASLDDDTGAMRPSGAPLVADGAVFIPMRRHGRAMQVESWLIALDLETGKRRWLRFLGASGAAIRGVVWPGDELIQHDHSIIAQTGTGALASLDPRDGSVDWLRRMSPGRWASRNDLAPKPWALARPLRVGPHLATLSADHDHVLVLNPETGAIRSMLPTAPGSPAANTLAVLPAGDAAMLTSGQSVIRWSLADDGTPTQQWIWTDDSQQLPTGRPHRVGDAVLVPLGDQLVALHINDGRPLGAIHHVGGGHATSIGGLIIISGPESITAVSGLESGLARLTRRMNESPEAIEPRLAIIDLAVSAGRRDLIQTHLPGALTIGRAAAPEAAIDSTIAALKVLDPDDPDDRGLVEAAVQVLHGGDLGLARLHLARGDWVEPSSVDKAIESWLAADSDPTGQTWAYESGIHAPIGALASRRLTRHGLEHAVVWPPASMNPGSTLRAGAIKGDVPQSNALQLMASASGPDAMAIAHVAGFDRARIDAIRDVTAGPLQPGGAARRLPGAAIPLPRNEGLLLQDGSRLTWHESPLVEETWTVTLDGMLESVIATDDTQIVMVLDRIGGGRKLQSRRRDDGSIRWTLNLDQFAKEIDPPVLLAATSDVAALAGRDRVYLVDLHSGTQIGQPPKGWPVDAVALQHHLVLLLDDPSSGRSSLHIVDADGRISPWPQPPRMPKATWLERGPLNDVVLGNANAMAFAPGPGDQWWWLADISNEDALRGAVVLPDAIVTRSHNGLIDRRDPVSGEQLGEIETPWGWNTLRHIELVPTGNGLIVVTDQGLFRLDAAGALLWAQASQTPTSPTLAIMAGDETLVLHATDLLHDALLPTEARTVHRIRRLDIHGRLMETVDLFPVASRIQLGRSAGGMLLLSDTLDTWLVPLLEHPLTHSEPVPQ